MTNDSKRKIEELQARVKKIKLDTAAILSRVDRCVRARRAARAPMFADDAQRARAFSRVAAQIKHERIEDRFWEGSTNRIVLL